MINYREPYGPDYKCRHQYIGCAAEEKNAHGLFVSALVKLVVFSIERSLRVSVERMREYNEERPHDTFDRGATDQFPGPRNCWKFSFDMIPLLGGEA